METDPSSSQINNNDGKRLKRHDDDMISRLPDDVLLNILQFVDLHTAVRTGSLARRWRHLPRLLPDLDINIGTMIPHNHWDFSVDRVMTTYTNATTWLLQSTQQRRRSLRLAFYLIEPYLQSIGEAVAATTADRLEFTIRTTNVDLFTTIEDHERVDHGVVFARRLMSFLTACPVVFARLTSLTLYNLSFSTPSEFTDLLNACNQLELLALNNCEATDIEIDAPNCSLLSLEIRACFHNRLELTRVPKLERLLCDANTARPDMRFGYVPCLRFINLCAEHLHYYCENPIQLSPTFHNLRDIYLCSLDISDMVWILFVLEAAPLLNNLSLQLSPRWCENGGLYKPNEARETPKFEHHNLGLLEIKAYGISTDNEVLHYIRLIRKVAVCLKKIHLLQQCEYIDCNGVTDLCRVDESRKRLLRDIITFGFSSSTEITMEQVAHGTQVRAGAEHKSSKEIMWSKIVIHKRYERP